MTEDNIRVLVVDDSAVMRAMISDQVAAAPGMSVAGGPATAARRSHASPRCART